MPARAFRGAGRHADCARDLPSQVTLERISTRRRPLPSGAHAWPLNKFERTPAGWLGGLRRLVGLAKPTLPQKRLLFLWSPFLDSPSQA